MSEEIFFQWLHRSRGMLQTLIKYIEFLVYAVYSTPGVCGGFDSQLNK